MLFFQTLLLNRSKFLRQKCLGMVANTDHCQSGQRTSEEGRLGRHNISYLKIDICEFFLLLFYNMTLLIMPTFTSFWDLILS